MERRRSDRQPYGGTEAPAGLAAEPAVDLPAGPLERTKDFVRGWLGPSPSRTSRADASAPGTDEVTDTQRAVGEFPMRVAADEPGQGHVVPPQVNQEFQQWTPLIDPLRVIGAIFDSKGLILAATIVGTLVGVGIALSTPKKYEAITELLVDPRDLKLSDRDLTQQGLPSDATLAIIENQVRVLTSGTVLGKVVDELKLDQDPEFNGQRKSFGLRSLIGELRAMLSRSSDDGGAADHRHTIAIENLARNLSVERGGKTFVVTIGARSESPEKSALIANKMREVFLQTSGEIQSQTAGRAADELAKGLDELRAGVEQAERKVAAFKAENDIIDPQGRLITDDEIIRLNEQLTGARARTLELNARAASVRDVGVDSVLGGAIPESLNSSVITELRSQYAALKNEADRLAVRLGPRHPQRQAIEAQLAGARDQIASELRRIGSSIQVELKRAVELEQQLAQRLAQLKVRQGDLGGELVELRELERVASTRRAVYESYLLRARETGEQRGINTANVSVISEAYPPLDPSGPSRSNIALTGMLLGFASGVGLAAMRGAYDSLRERRRQDRNGRRGPAPFSPGPGGSSPGPSGERSPLLARRSDHESPVPGEGAVRPDQADRFPNGHGRALRSAANDAHGYAWPSSHRSPIHGRPSADNASIASHASAYPYSEVIPYPELARSRSQQAGYQGWSSPERYVRAAEARMSPVEPGSAEAIAEIRASLAEFREAVRDLTESRQKRRFL
ncbi:GumC family protein [Arvimicrobium flavum]|uniref:GumC family protein n=1 Tax=Arvimicrobium flavum TaxID=3393320 RepID=UPI003083F98B